MHDTTLDLQAQVKQHILAVGKWTVPGGSVRPGQPLVRLKQASVPRPRIKNQFNIGARNDVSELKTSREKLLHWSCVDAQNAKREMQRQERLDKARCKGAKPERNLELCCNENDCVFGCNDVSSSRLDQLL